MTTMPSLFPDKTKRKTLHVRFSRTVNTKGQTNTTYLKSSLYWKQEHVNDKTENNKNQREAAERPHDFRTPSVFQRPKSSSSYEAKERGRL